MSTGNGLGNLFNVIMGASGVHIRMKHGEAATFTAFLAAGTHSWTLKESQNGANEQNLAVIDTIYKTPGTGAGTWIEVTQTAAATYAVTDAVNDQIMVTVRADQLSPGFDSLEMTGSLVVAVVTGLREPASPENLDSLITL